MIQVSVVAELMEEYTAVLARVLEHLFHDAPFPRRVRVLVLRSLPFAASASSSRSRIRMPPPPPPPLLQLQLQPSS